MQESSADLIGFLIIATLSILSLVGFTILVLFLYQRKQEYYSKTMASIELEHEKDLLKTQLEIQEETFLNISREIHDNIGLALTLAKLNLNTLSIREDDKSKEQLSTAVGLIGKAISDLRDISKSLNSDIISQVGWLKQLEDEIEKIQKFPQFSASFRIIGQVIFLESYKELILFRIAQEALNNILKHSEATEIQMEVIFNTLIELKVKDNGKGFVTQEKAERGNQKMRLGLTNMANRAKLINGVFNITSEPGIGTTVSVKVPVDQIKIISDHDQNSISRRSYTPADSSGVIN